MPDRKASIGGMRRLRAQSVGHEPHIDERPFGGNLAAVARELGKDRTQIRRSMKGRLSRDDEV
jgi:hypothetical protein